MTKLPQDEFPRKPKRQRTEGGSSADVQLRGYRTLLRIACRVGRLGGWELDAATGCITWSGETRSIHEAAAEYRPTLEEAIDFYAPEHRNIIRRAAEQCLRDGTPFDEELRFITAKGRQIWVRSIGEAERDEAGKIVRIRGAIQDVSELRDALQGSARGEERFRQFADTMPLVVWTADTRGSVDYLNRYFLDYAGLPPDIPPGESWQGCLHPDDLSRCLQHWGRCVSSGDHYEIRYRIRGGEGNEYRWFQVQAELVRDSSGTSWKWIGTAVDIHETLLLEKRSAQLASRITDTLESITDAFFTLDSQWQFSFLNSEAERLIERPRAELIGKSLWQEFPEAQGTRFETEYVRAVSEHQTASFEAYYPPLRRWFEVRAYPTIDGLAVYFRDITQRRSNEEQLRLLSTCVDRANDIIVITDAEFAGGGPRIVFVNDAFVRRTGYRRDEAIGRRPDLLHGPETDRRAVVRIRDAMIDGRPIREELVNYTKDGESFWLDIDLVPVAGTETDFTHWVGIGRDVSERKESESKLRQSEERFRLLNEELEQRVRERTRQLEEAVKELEAFCYTVSHDLRAPLRGVDSFSRIVIEDYGKHLDHEANRLLEIIRNEASRMDRLINDLLDFSRSGRRQIRLGRCDMAEQVQSVIDSLPPADREHVREFVIEELPPARCDRTMARLVWANLIANAVKFTRNRSDAVIEIGGRAAGDLAEYHVRDNGAGFDPRHAGKLFDVFHRLHADDEFEGTGVGLAIVARVVRRHGGTVWAEGSPGAGAIFYFTLPISE